MKEVLIDIFKIKDLYSGLGQFSKNFANELLRQSNGDMDFVFLTPSDSEFDKDNGARIEKDSFQKRYFPMLNKSYDIWHSLHQFPAHKPGRKSKHILTIHDLNFLIEKDDVKKTKYLKRLQKNVDRADCITTISDYTKKTIEENLDLKGKQVRTIYNGITVDVNTKVVKPSFISDNKFFFSIGIFSEKKNFHVLLKMLKEFPEHHLVIAGNYHTTYGRKIRDQIIVLGLTGRVHLVGKVKEAEKSWLYNNCEAFLFPSLAEGFGMPPIEAMKFGKPVFLSKYTSLPEVGGDVAYYFDDFESKNMASLVNEKLSIYNNDKENLSERIKKHADKFSWEKCIREYKELYKEVLG